MINLHCPGTGILSTPHYGAGGWILTWR